MAHHPGQLAAYDCDVLVIGGGLAGLAAGVRLAQGGTKVLVLERHVSRAYPCNTRLSAGLFHCCGKPLDSDFGELDDLILQRTGGRAAPDLVGAVTMDAMRVIGWLRDVGVDIARGKAHLSYAHELQPPVLGDAGYAWPGRGADVMLQRLEAALTEQGGRLLRGHEATSLRKAGDAVAGCEGRRSDGQRFLVSAAAVVLATGGFESDPALLRESITGTPEKLYARNAGTGRGDAIRMARAAGASISTLGGFYGHVVSISAFDNTSLSPFPYLDAVLRVGIVVNAGGERFADEGQGGTFMANAIAAQPDPLGAFVIADRHIWEHCGRDPAMPHTAPNPALIDAGARLYRAGTLRELAAASGIDPVQLQESVADHNLAVHEKDGSVLRPPRSSARWKPLPIKTPPFYAFPVCAAITYTMDGVATNADAQALDGDGHPVPGLYAVGCSAGGLEGGPAAGYVSGLLKAAVTGLRAAEAIARTLCPALV